MWSGKGERRVLLLCGDYMEDHKSMVPFQALQAYGVTVDAVCPDKKAGDYCRTAIHQHTSAHQTHPESSGHNFALNATFDDIEYSNYDGIIIPGRRSPEYLAMDASVLELVNKLAASRKIIAAICRGVLVLAAAGLVKGRNCTGFPPMRPVLLAGGDHWVEPDTMGTCIADGNIITGVTYEGK